MNGTIRIVARSNLVGIDRDIRILVSALDPRWGEVEVSSYRGIHPLRRYIGSPDRSESIVFLGRIRPRWLRSAGRYVLIPNQERFPERLVPLLDRIDHVFCKSRCAEATFSALHPSVHYLGFTSLDRRLPEIEPDFDRFFHLAGGSSLKGTEDLLSLWAQHPEWPTLTLLWHRKDAIKGGLPGNVQRIERYLSDPELQKLQNQCGIHLCPSRSEGWGHYIVEAMSCGAVALTTDGPPMNELVQADRGVLVPHARSAPRKLGTDYFVDPAALEQTIQHLIAQPSEAKAALGRRARAWFEANDARFLETVNRLWELVVPAPEVVENARTSR